jgi:peptidoglycan hydrolase-like protein with peptidoglycan-binding domain
MPASQRAMMERMMGSQIEQMRSLVRGGAVEFEVVTTSIVVNPDLSAQSPTSIAIDGESRLIRIIQEHLTTLGYDPGNINGELTRATVVAITRFEAAQGIEVTGRPTPQLAGILAAAVDTRRGNP